MPIAAMIALPLIGAAFVWKLGKLYLQLRKGHYSLAIEQSIELLALLYPIGVVLKLSGWGLDFGRYYLADIGFPVALVAMAAIFIKRRQWYEDHSTEQKRAQSYMNYAKNRLKLVPVALGISVAYEMFAGYVNRTTTVPVPYIGDFDWIDIAMYVLGSIAVALLLVWKLKLYRAYFNSARRLEEAEQYARSVQQALRAAAPQPVRKYHKKRVKRGVR